MRPIQTRRRCVQRYILQKRHAAKSGAHPPLPGLQGFGRSEWQIRRAEAGPAAIGITAHWPYGLPRQHRSLSMAKGTVKWFNPTKGYGFIQPAGGGGKDVFVHISAVEKAGLSTLNEGQTVEYEEVPNKGKTSAENLKVV
jgi:CspA family cold shock protein